MAAGKPREKLSISTILVVTAPMQGVAWSVLAPAVAVPTLPHIATNGTVAHLRRF